MSRIPVYRWLAPVLLAIAVSGCSSGIGNLSQRVGSQQAQDENWSPTGPHMRGYQLGIQSIVCGPRLDGILGGRFVAASRYTLHPMGTRVSLARFSHEHVTIWDGSGVMLLSQELPRSSGCVRFTQDGQECLLAAETGVLAWSLEDRTVESRLPTEHRPLAFSTDGRLVVVRKANDERDRICVLSIEDGRELGSIELDVCTAVVFVDGDRRLGFVEQSVKANRRVAFVWDYATDARTPEIEPASHRGTFSPDGSRYAGQAAGNAVRVWDTETATILFTTGEHSSHIWAMAFSPDRRFLASSGEGEGQRDRDVGEIKIWDAETGTELATIIDDSSWGVTALTFSLEGTELVSGNGDGGVRFWRVPDLPTSSVGLRGRADR